MAPERAPSADLVVVGTASRDTLHVGGRTEETVGGAGLYTALAAACCGAEAVLCAPRPHPMPPAFAGALHLIRWAGPVVAPADLPRLEIAHLGGGRAILREARWGAEGALDASHLPADLRARAVHVAALSSAGRQAAFAHAARERGARLVSAGTYAVLATRETAAVRDLFSAADVVFLNENEARILYGEAGEVPRRPGQLAFVTRGDRGVRVLGAARFEMDAVPAIERDPTGAGDTFCGAALAHLLRGESPHAAARAAVALAARTVAAIGPGALLPG